MYGDNTVLTLNNGLGKGKPQPDSLCIKGMFAAIKAFKDMVNIFRDYAVTIIRNKNPKHSRSALPCNTDNTASLRVIQCIFYNVSNRFTCPFHVTNKLLFTIAIYLNLLAFAFSPCG